MRGDIRSVRLHRGLGVPAIVGLTLNTVVGAGVLGLPAALAATAGHLSLVVLLAAFGLVALLALCMMEVASRYDANGGPVLYAANAFGPLAGFCVGWLSSLSRLSSFGAIAGLMLDYAAGPVPLLAEGAWRFAVITVFVALLMAVNLRGIVQGALVSNLLMLAKGLPLVALAAAGLSLIGNAAAPAALPPGQSNLSAGLILAFFACMGFEQATVVAGEARNPQSDIPRGVLVGLGLAGLLYALLLLACFATVPDLAGDSRPLASAASALIGSAGATAVTVTAVISCAGGLSVTLLVTPRVLHALSVQGDLPLALGRLQPARLVPAAAIVTTALIAWLLAVTGTFTYLATFAVMARMLMYMVSCAALIRLRRRDGAAPLAVPAGPVWAVVAAASCAAAMATSGGTAVRDLLVALAAGLALRAGVHWWRRPRA